MRKTPNIYGLSFVYSNGYETCQISTFATWDPPVIKAVLVTFCQAHWRFVNVNVCTSLNRAPECATQVKHGSASLPIGGRAQLLQDIR